MPHSKLGVTSILLPLFIIFIAPKLYAGDHSDRPQSVIKHQLSSNILKEQRNIFVMLPKEYSPNNSTGYDVVFVISSNRLAYNLSQDMDILSRDKRVPDSIVVSIPSKNADSRLRDLTPPFLKRSLDPEYSGLGQADKFLDFINNEVVPMIQSNYRTTKQKILLGHSRAGLLVVYSLLYKPELFTGRVALSPALWREENLIVAKLAKQLRSKDLNSSYLFMSMGTLEVTKMKQAFDLAIAELKDQPKNSLRWDSQYQIFADHSSNPYLTAATGLLGYYRSKKNHY